MRKLLWSNWRVNLFKNISIFSCCNTCEEVKDAYKLRRWEIEDISVIEQCQNELINEPNQKENHIEEGCRLYGKIDVGKV